MIDKYSDNQGVVDVLDISFEDTDDEYHSISKVIENGKIDTIANFIMNFMYPGITTEEDITLSFDGNSRIIGKIFRNFNRASNIIIPQTIADSAPTSFNFLSQNEFYFPSQNNSNEYIIRSNIFTHDKKVDMKFVNHPVHPFSAETF